MAKFYGNVGYAILEETEPGIWEEKLTERKHRGDLLRCTTNIVASENLNDNLRLAYEISILANPFAMKNYHYIRYVEYGGVKWKVTSVRPEHPRLILSVGGVYNGQ